MKRIGAVNGQQIVAWYKALGWDLAMAAQKLRTSKETLRNYVLNRRPAPGMLIVAMNGLTLQASMGHSLVKPIFPYFDAGDRGITRGS